MNKRIAKKIVKACSGWFRLENLWKRHSKEQFRRAKHRLYPPGDIGRLLMPFVSLIEDQSLKDLVPINDTLFVARTGKAG